LVEKSEKSDLAPPLKLSRHAVALVVTQSKAIGEITKNKIGEIIKK